MHCIGHTKNFSERFFCIYETDEATTTSDAAEAATLKTATAEDSWCENLFVCHPICQEVVDSRGCVVECRCQDVISNLHDFEQQEQQPPQVSAVALLFPFLLRNQTADQDQNLKEGRLLPGWNKGQFLAKSVEGFWKKKHFTTFISKMGIGPPAERRAPVGAVGREIHRNISTLLCCVDYRNTIAFVLRDVATRGILTPIFFPIVSRAPGDSLSALPQIVNFCPPLVGLRRRWWNRACSDLPGDLGERLFVRRRGGAGRTVDGQWGGVLDVHLRHAPHHCDPH